MESDETTKILGPADRELERELARTGRAVNAIHRGVVRVLRRRRRRRAVRATAGILLVVASAAFAVWAVLPRPVAAPVAQEQGTAEERVEALRGELLRVAHAHDVKAAKALAPIIRAADPLQLSREAVSRACMALEVGDPGGHPSRQWVLAVARGHAHAGSRRIAAVSYMVMDPRWQDDPVARTVIAESESDR